MASPLDAMEDIPHASENLNELAEFDMRFIDEKRRLNEPVPICQLPPELLSEVFVFYVMSTLIPPPGWPALQRIAISRKWIGIAHVCHLWRQIALNTPSLWREFDVDDVEWTEAMLTRSKATPLRISASGVGEHNRECLNRVFREFHRIEAIELIGCGEVDINSALEVGSYAPLLKSLVVTGAWRRVAMRLFDYTDMPQLTRLYLVQDRIFWSSPLLKQTLTHLDLSGTKDAREIIDNTDMGFIASVLSNMQGLRSLKLHDVLPKIADDSTPPRHDHRINLPHLRRLHLSTPSMTCIHFLRHLSLPPSVKINISLLDYKPTLVSDLLIPDIISIFNGSRSDSRFSPLSVLCQDEQVRVWTESLTLDHLARQTRYISFDGYVKPSLSLQFTGRMPRNSDLFPVLCNALPLGGADTFLYGVSGFTRGPSQSDWTAVLRQMSNLRCLGVYANTLAVSALADALAEEVALADDAHRCDIDGIHPLLPGLEVLMLDTMEWRQDPDDLDDEGGLLHYRSMLRKRQEQFCGLRRLVIRDCSNLGQMDVYSLRGLVGVIEWDEKETWGPNIWTLRDRHPRPVAADE